MDIIIRDDGELNEGCGTPCGGRDRKIIRPTTHGKLPFNTGRVLTACISRRLKHTKSNIGNRMIGCSSQGKPESEECEKRQNGAERVLV